MNFVEAFLDEVQGFVPSGFAGLMEGSIRKALIDTVISLSYSDKDSSRQIS